MPKLADITVTARHPDEGRVSHTAKYPCSVDSAGQFHAEIPAGLRATFDDLCRRTKAEHGCKVADMRKRGGGSAPAVTGASLSGVRAVLYEFGKSMVEADVTTELRIFYTLRLGAHYYKDEAGGIHPNGRCVPDYDNDKGRWCGDRNRFHDSEFAVGAGASVVLVQTVTPPGGAAAVSYESPDSDDERIGEHGKRLREWTHQPFPRNEHMGAPSKMRSVPYTEAAAQMFCQVLLGLAVIADRLETNLADAEALPALLEGGGLALLSGPST